jgi:hypothetical protein
MSQKNKVMESHQNFDGIPSLSLFFGYSLSATPINRKIIYLKGFYARIN